MPYAQNERTTLWYSDQGAGDPVLLIHGGLFDPIDGKRFWERPGIVDRLLTLGYRVLVPDRRYSPGLSSTNSFNVYTWEQEAADFVAIIRAAEVPAVSLIAGSNGCSAAIRFAVAYPSLIRSLVLCWPVAPENELFQRAFERSAALVEQVGPTVYLKSLREHGVPRPDDERGGFPFGFALLHDSMLADALCHTTPQEAARSIRETAKALLAGNVLRGVSTNDTAMLAEQPFPIGIMPADPENPVHTQAIAQELTKQIAGAHLLKGFPEPLTPNFAAVRTEFCAILQKLMR